MKISPFLVGHAKRDGSPVLFGPLGSTADVENAHVMVTGSSGKGKTQFAKYVVCRLREYGVRVVLLDFKNDFAGDQAFLGLARLQRVSVPFGGLPFNPLVPYPVLNPDTGERVFLCRQHATGIADILRQVYGLGLQQARAVKRSIEQAYEEMNVPLDRAVPAGDIVEFPDFSIVGKILEKKNLAAFSRLDPLFTSGLFREEVRQASFEALAAGSFVLDLSRLQSDELKNALAQLVVMSAHAFYNALPHASGLRQYLVFDEAHRVLKSEFMERLVREGRAYGVGVILVSQFPADFPPAISGSLATKVLHGNGPDHDKVQAIARILGGGAMAEEIASLARFEAFFDNQQYRTTKVRTMHFPLYLAWKHVEQRGPLSEESLSLVEGLDPQRMAPAWVAEELLVRGVVRRDDEGRLVAVGLDG